MKSNTLLQNQKANHFKINLEYEEWLRDFIKNPNNKEIKAMGKDSINNLSYNPIQGA